MFHRRSISPPNNYDPNRENVILKSIYPPVTCHMQVELIFACISLLCIHCEAVFTDFILPI
ncbi:hypothetical protein BD779DRAFT_1639860 [Infundibulicybe gibba]|nr:hypothetical protein BD779DRAFT_1639860 [Infundibulicybe gibba]